MSIYVDDAFLGWRGKRWCHMQADTLEELHEFAQSIGLKREWFQPGSRPEAAHYDVSEPLRQRALASGAIPETTEDGSQRRRAARQARFEAES